VLVNNQRGLAVYYQSIYIWSLYFLAETVAEPFG